MMYYRVAKTKALISYAITAKLICAFVFAYADCWFSLSAALTLFCLKVPQDTYECLLIIDTFRSISIKKRIGNRVYSAAHVSSLTMPRSLLVVLLNIHSGFQVDFRENYSDHS